MKKSNINETLTSINGEEKINKLESVKIINSLNNMKTVKGISNFKVYDKNGNLKQELTQHNLLTNYQVDDIKMSIDPNIQVLRGAVTRNFYGTANTPEKLSKGIILFANQLSENTDDYCDQLFNSTEIGHAGDATATTSATQGVTNPNATVITDTSITRQWVFGQGIANGTILSCGLCNQEFGIRGLQDLNYKNNGSIMLGQSQDDNDGYTGFGVSQIALTYYTLDALNNRVYNSIKALGYYDGILYGYTLTNSTQINIYKFTISDIYNIKSVMPRIVKQQYGMSTYIVDGNAPCYTYTLPETPDYMGINAAFIQPMTINSNTTPMAYFQYNASGTEIVRMDLNAFTSTNYKLILPSEMAGTYHLGDSGATHFLGLAVTDDGVWLGSINTLKVFRFSLITLQFEESMTLPSLSTSYTDKTVNVYNYNNKVFRVVAGADSTGDYPILSDGTHWSCPGGSNGYGQTMIRIDGYKNLYISCSNSSFNLTQAIHGLYTINNLSGPVVKNNEDVLVVTYSLIDDASAPS